MGYVPFTFSAISDPQEVWATGYYSRLAERFGEADFDTSFVTIVGDLVEYGISQPYWNRFFKESAPYLNKYALQPNIGNHDGRTPDSLYRKYINISTLPDNFYFAFNYSNVQFISAEQSDWKGMDDELLKAQIIWLNQTLMNGIGFQYRILMIHQMMDWVVPFIDLFNITLTLCGHYHHYDRYTLAGETIIQLGSGGSIQDLIYKTRPTSQKVLFQPSYTQISVTNQSIEINTFSPDKVLLDHAVIGGAK
jgi:hypothetical protein